MNDLLVYKSMVRDIYDKLEEELIYANEWEMEFIESIDARLQLGRELSEKQASTLDNIWRRCHA